MTTNYDKIKTRIAALIAKAKGTDNEHEAAAFIAKAEELLEQYQLDMADIDGNEDKVRHHPGLDADGKWVASWHRHVYRALAEYYGCKTIKVMTVKGYRQEVVGRESAIVTTDLMFDHIKAECNRLGRELHQSGGAPSAANGARLVGNALTTRILSLVMQRDKAAPRSTEAAKNALVTMDQIEALYKELYPDSKTLARSSRKTSANARELAGSIGLHRQAGHSAALQIGGR